MQFINNIIHESCVMVLLGTSLSRIELRDLCLFQHNEKYKLCCISSTIFSLKWLLFYMLRTYFKYALPTPIAILSSDGR